MLQFGQRRTGEGIERLVTIGIPAAIPLQATAAPPLGRVFNATVRAWKVRSRGVEKGISLGADLPKDLVCQVFLDIDREASQGLLEGFEV